MEKIEEVTIQCPYCGEMIDILVDTSAGKQKYIEDCQVCCRPITMFIQINEEGEPLVRAAREDEL